MNLAVVKIDCSISYVNMSHLVSTKVLDNGDAVCIENNGDIWINYTDINDLCVSYWVYGQDTGTGGLYLL